MTDPTIYIINAKDIKGTEAKLKELKHDVIIIVPENCAFDLEKMKPSLVLKFNELKERTENRKSIIPVLPPKSFQNPTDEIRKKRPRIYK